VPYEKLTDSHRQMSPIAGFKTGNEFVYKMRERLNKSHPKKLHKYTICKKQTRTQYFHLRSPNTVGRQMYK